MIEMEMRGQDDVDRVWRHAGLCESVIEIASAIDAEDVCQFRIEFVPDATIDDHPPPISLDHERAHGHHDPAAIVGGRLFFPQRPRNDPEHPAAVEAKRPVADSRQLQVSP